MKTFDEVLEAKFRDGESVKADIHAVLAAQNDIIAEAAQHPRTRLLIQALFSKKLIEGPIPFGIACFIGGLSIGLEMNDTTDALEELVKK